ncbi:MULTISPECIES: hypothetical protein [Staphylococcus]|uniref:hypothetical protein n=1 Tax=Staphylococcus TaxID=1279 RepID=UPI000951170E|nr:MULTISPECIES: hypothetical protein [Staphylococcus]OLS09495.1 hypothetical protein AUK68_00535 [Staphylococcus epidermidis]AXV41213.1 hypothetical protein Ssp1_01070 [Staphylococcus sp. M0911]PTI18233.1 hypothetical protein BU082_11420 [Staphylococcus warneri]PTI26759.1 hypothetical protein BU081_02040 [Staphylococcus warneri]PTI59227.1 hypothetical protein BU090_10590 [Staphylococcus warneri]
MYHILRGIIILLSMTFLVSCSIDNKDKSHTTHKTSEENKKKTASKKANTENKKTSSNSENINSNTSQNQQVQNNQPVQQNPQQAQTNTNPTQDKQLQDIENYEAYLRSKDNMTESDFKKYNELVGDRQLPGDIAQRIGHNGVSSDDLATENDE